MFLYKERNKIFGKKIRSAFGVNWKKCDFIKKNQIYFEQLKKNWFFGLYVKKKIRSVIE